MTAYWLYCRLNVHVSMPDDELMLALDTYADRHVKGGRAVLKQEHRDAIRHQHADAAALYRIVTR